MLNWGLGLADLPRAVASSSASLQPAKFDKQLGLHGYTQQPSCEICV